MTNKESKPVYKLLNINNYPYPIAHAWKLATDEKLSPTVRHINAIACFYQCIRFIAIAFAGWYTYRLDPNIKVEKALIDLKRPTMGSWYAFIKSCMKNIFTDEGNWEEALTPLIKAVKKLEETKWDSGNTTGKNNDEVVYSAFSWFIHHRNTYHGHFTTLTDQESVKALNLVLPKLHFLLESLSCLTDYALIYKALDSNKVYELNAQIEDDFPEAKVTNDLDELLLDLDSTEIVALIYHNSELIIPLTFFVTREYSNENYDGLIKFKTSDITGEPLIFDGINIREREVIYLGSGSRRFRNNGFNYFKDFFNNRNTISEKLLANENLIEVLNNRFQAQLSVLRGFKYHPQTYITRDIETYLVKQITNSPNHKPVTLLLGSSGSGKTSLICNIAYKLSTKKNNKHQISLQLANTVKDQTQTLEFGLANNLGYMATGDYDLEEILTYWFNENKRLGITNPYLWIFWDALNEGANLKELFDWVEEYASTIANFNTLNNANVRLITSCRLEPWNELVQNTRVTDPNAWPIDTTHLQHYKNRQNEVQPFALLEHFTLKEARLCYETYRDWAIEYNDRYCRSSWTDLNQQLKELLCLPLNIWLFHNTFDKQYVSSNLTLSTFSLWLRNLSNLVFKSYYLHLAIIAMGQQMWSNQSSSIDIDLLTTLFNKKLNAELATSLQQIGMDIEVFQSLPSQAQQALITTNKLKVTSINPIELLEVSELVIVNEDYIQFSYQTLSEAILTIVIWEDILPEYKLTNTGQDEDLASLIIVSQNDQLKTQPLDTKLESYKKLATWSDGKTALYNVWATRAKLALRYNHFNEAEYNLKQLQLRAQSNMIIDIIEKNNYLSDPTLKLKIDSILFDMIHIQGRYKEAADLIITSLENYEQQDNKDEYLILSLKIRHIHHRMFYEQIQPLWLQCKNLLEQIDKDRYPDKYGEALFMLGGNLGALAGDYDYQRKIIIKAIRHAQKYEDEYLMSRSLRKYVDYLRLKKKFKFALTCWEAAWNISEKSQTTRQGIYLLCVLADLNRQKENFDLAIQNFNKTIELAKKSEISGWLGHANLGLAETYIQLNQVENATLYLDKALSFYTQTNQAWGQVQVAISQYRLHKLTMSQLVESSFDKALELCEHYGYLEDKKYLITESLSEKLNDRCLMFL